MLNSNYQKMEDTALTIYRHMEYEFIEGQAIKRNIFQHTLKDIKDYDTLKSAVQRYLVQTESEFKLHRMYMNALKDALINNLS